jgi:hypothetical protein
VNAVEQRQILSVARAPGVRDLIGEGDSRVDFGGFEWAQIVQPPPTVVAQPM